jgi:hypothetical protein
MLLYGNVDAVEESKPTHFTPASTHRVQSGTLASHYDNVSMLIAVE